MNQVNDHFAGLERYHLQQNHLPAFNQFLNGDASTSSNVVIHLNGTSESIMQSSNVGLQSDPPSNITTARKRKRSSVNDGSVFKCSYCPKKFDNQALVSLWEI